MNYRINSDRLNALSTECWYVNGSGGTASIGVNFTLSNGQSISSAALGRFSIYRPAFRAFTTVNPLFPLFPRTFLWWELGPYALSYGIYYTTKQVQYWAVTVDAKCDGTLGIAQLVRARYSAQIAIPPYYRVLLDTGGEYCRDGSADNYEELVFAARANDAGRTISLHDGPCCGVALANTITMEGSFKNYLRFRPGNIVSDPTFGENIFVTIAEGDWTMLGVADIGQGVTTSQTPPLSGLVDSDQFFIYFGTVSSNQE